MSIDYLLNHVMISEKVLDCHAVIGSPVPLKVLVTSATRVQTVVLEGFTSPAQLL